MEKTVADTPLLRNEFCPGKEKKGEDVGCEVLFAPLSRVLPYERGSRRVMVEMRPLGFNWVLSHGYESKGVQHPGWAEMTETLFDLALAVNTPRVTGVAPNKGPAKGGQGVAIYGTGFVAGASVKIGGTPATDVVVQGTNSLTVRTPPGTSGRAADVVVTTPAGSSPPLRKGFSYSP